MAELEINSLAQDMQVTGAPYSHKDLGIWDQRMIKKLVLLRYQVI
jgi:hypothetical protein